MNNFPKVSVVTITYGHQDYIIEMIKSVFAQKYNGIIEFIIANDCSPDNTDKIIKDFLVSHPIPKNIEIKYTCHEKNLGMMPNAFFALKQVTGQYIASCEGDDFWTDPLKLQKQIDFLETNPEYALTFTNVNVIYEKLTYEVGAIASIKESREYTGVEILKNWIAHTSTYVYRNGDYIKEFENFYRSYSFIYGDTPLFLYILQFGKAYGFVDYTSSYRRHDGGAASEKESLKNILDYIKHLIFINKAFKNKKYTRVNNNLISFRYFSLFSGTRDSFKLKTKYLFKCLYYDPFFLFKIIKEKFLKP
ncbi:glycosyltransferase [Elizabethkingia anophelis]|uniref:Glycosyl transferase n=1 Tax=Elizabethkingia anophelis R26 TaxID=1246994 RepID=A0ABM6MSP4_9FLAO|nr:MULTISPECIES: glycosyltransferase [Elizabethkingia]ATC36153.1 glycosyl transferase [Elizabethkingia anophelis R26]ATC39830.1 glycosyl transferase [Elizabethkingia anophelis Ag1]ATC43509.1 glycosyl transferase [Elizabethkingia anophelis]ATC47185.1 glycosyl transferase [Elizabethkingia anophelis]ELR81026.1 glycosyl transferase [Elizabethkingia anophelis R26]